MIKYRTIKSTYLDSSFYRINWVQSCFDDYTRRSSSYDTFCKIHKRSLLRSASNHAKVQEKDISQKANKGIPTNDR